MTATRTAQRRSTVRRSLVGAVATAGLVGTLASTAVAAPPPGSETDPTGKPNLAFSAFTAGWTGSAWRVAFTVVNKGDGYARTSTMSAAGGSFSVPGLAVGATWSGSRLVGDAYGCATSFSGTLDTGRVVVETSEYDNTRSVIASKPGCPPRFKVRASHFYVNDESGYDGSGSDEPYWTLHAATGKGQVTGRLSQTFGDVDTGETHWFTGESCVLGCDSNLGAEIGSGMGLSTQLWELDAMEGSQVHHKLAEDIGNFVGNAADFALEGDWASYTDRLGNCVTASIDYVLNWLHNDNLGFKDVGYGASTLLNLLPSPNRTTHISHVLSDGDATYTVTFAVTRTV